MKAFARASALLVFALVLGSFSSAHAESLDNQDQTLPQPSNVAPTGEDVDNILTNANLRAASGSKSTWSLSNSITYDGGTIAHPFAEARPNIAGASATSLDTDINDTISLKYSINAVDSLLLGFGVRKMAPFTGGGPSEDFYAKGGKDVDFFDPSLTFQHVYKFWGIQAIATVGYTQYTRADIRSPDNDNQLNNVSFDQENIYEIGNWSVGASVGVGGGLPTDWDGSDFSAYQFWLDPYVEYRFNDTLNFRTVANMLSYEVYHAAGIQQDNYTQSVGLGISITRDIYLYPNIQFLPEHMAWELTNVGLSATVNLF